MKNLICLFAKFGLYVILLLHFFACDSDTDTNAEKQLTGKWCKPDVEIKGLLVDALTQEEKSQYKFLMGGIEKMFEEMCIEYFDDRRTGRDSYQMSMALSGDSEKQSEFGEYELLANGKRLVLHTPENKNINIELTKLTKTEHQWRLQYSDMMKLSGEEVDLPEDLPNFSMYLTFKKEK